jgi:hypothetical protein
MWITWQELQLEGLLHTQQPATGKAPLRMELDFLLRLFMADVLPNMASGKDGFGGGCKMRAHPTKLR